MLPEVKNAGEPEILSSGGAVPTIFTTSFLLLGEDVIAYNKGEEIKLKPYSGALNIDFGKGVRKRNVYLLNLPEVKSAFKTLDVPTVSARFEFLRDKSKVLKLVEPIHPRLEFQPEGIPIEVRKLLLEGATQGTTNFVMNK
ncbi:hypothetical protein ACP4OV_003658 [Aristida adscensionis]